MCNACRSTSSPLTPSLHPSDHPGSASSPLPSPAPLITLKATQPEAYRRLTRGLPVAYRWLGGGLAVAWRWLPREQHLGVHILDICHPSTPLPHRLSARSAPRPTPSHFPRAHQTGEPLEAAIVSPLDVLGEAARWKLPHAQVILQALAANAVLFAARIGAIAEPRVTRLLAFHNLGVVRRPCSVNSDHVLAGWPLWLTAAGWESGLGWEAVWPARAEGPPPNHPRPRCCSKESAPPAARRG